MSDITLEELKEIRGGFSTVAPVVPQTGSLYDELLAIRPLAPEVDDSGLWEGLKIFSKGLTKLPTQLLGKSAAAVQGWQGASVVDQDWMDRQYDKARKAAEEFSGQYDAEKKILPGVSERDMADLPENLAFSGLSALAGLGVGIPTAMIPIPGARPAAWGAGMLASGKAAYNMASYDFMKRYLEVRNEEKLEETGEKLTIPEEDALRKEFGYLAQKTGLWEAIPEAVGQATGLKLIITPLKKMATVLGKSVISRLITKVGGVYGVELATETVTQMGQTNVEYEAGLGDERRSWTDPAAIWKSTKEVAPAVFLLTTVMGASATVGARLAGRSTREKEENAIAVQKIVSETKPAILEEIQVNLVQGTVSLEEVEAFRDQYSQQANIDPDLIVQLDDIIKQHSETVAPVDNMFPPGDAATEKRMVFAELTDFETLAGDMSLVDTIEAGDALLAKYPWLQKQVDEIIVNAQSHAPVQPAPLPSEAPAETIAPLEEEAPIETEIVAPEPIMEVKVTESDKIRMMEAGATREQVQLVRDGTLSKDAFLKPKKTNKKYAKNLFARLAQDKVAFGYAYNDKIQTKGKRKKNLLLEQHPDVKALRNEKSGIAIDGWISILNEEGYNIRDVDHLYDLIITGKTREYVAPGREDLLEDKLEAEHTAWLMYHNDVLEGLENEGIDRGTVRARGEEVRGQAEETAKAETQDEALGEIGELEGLSTEEVEALSSEASDFFQEIATQQETLEDLATEAETGALPQKQYDEKLTPEGYEKTDYDQVDLEGKVEPIIQKKEEVEHKPDQQGAMFTSVLGQELGNIEKEVPLETAKETEAKAKEEEGKGKKPVEKIVKEGIEDLTRKSNADLAADAFKIINDHFGERGSVSGEKLELSDSLYEKLKPILAEFARRAKAKALDVKSYLFGAVDSMPDDNNKALWEEAAERYVEKEKEGVRQGTENILDNLKKDDIIEFQDRDNKPATGTVFRAGQGWGEVRLPSGLTRYVNADNFIKVIEQPSGKATEASLGQNNDGKDIYKDERGVRYVTYNGVKRFAPVPIIPGRAGVGTAKMSPEELFKQGSREFLTTEELATFEEKGKPDTSKRAFKVGDRVVVEDQAFPEPRHGYVVEDKSVVWQTTAWGGATSSDLSEWYNVKTDSGFIVHAQVKNITRETISELDAPKAVPDIEVEGEENVESRFFAPSQVLHRANYARESARKADAAAVRARKQSNINDYRSRARRYKEEAATYQRAFDKWAEKYPEEADKYREKPKETTMAPEDKKEAPSALGNYGLIAAKTVTKNGKPVWEISGETRMFKDSIKAAGGRWYRIKKVWSFYGEEDPTDRLLEELPDSPHPSLKIEGAASIPEKTVTVTPGPTTTEVTEEEITATDKASSWVSDQLSTETQITWRTLFAECNDAFGGTQSEGKYTVKDAYDALEIGINKYILNESNVLPQAVDISNAKQAIKDLNYLLTLIPTQTRRTEEMEDYQQFSTPPPLAYVVAWAANISERDVVLEPSAGTGNLAIFANIAKAKEVIVNELSDRRMGLLGSLEFDSYFNEDAEQLNNILPKTVKPTVVIMNPPFSAAGERLKGKRDSKIGAKHIEQALKRIEPGGRLVAIVGSGMSDSSAKFSEWWKKIKSEYNVRANIALSGKGYVKYGTTFDNQIIIIDKTGKTEDTITVQRIENLEEVLPLLEEVRDERNHVGEADRLGQQAQGQQAGERAPEEGRSEGGLQPDTRPATGVVGDEVGRPGDRGLQGDIATGGANLQLDTERGGGVLATGRAGEHEESSGSGSVGVRSTGQQNVSDVAGLPEGKSVAVETKKETHHEESLTDSIYETYRPERLSVPGSVTHPGKLVQSAAMAAVYPPDPKYSPTLPDNIIKKGLLSDAQLEPIVYAGQAHQELLPNGNRKGFFVGDGTGVGKGRIIAGTIWDNWNKGRKKAVWISEKAGLFNDAKRDAAGAGWNPGVVFSSKQVKARDKIDKKEGVYFTTYDTLKMGAKKSIGGVETGQSRVDQLVEWLGADFDGVIAFDESHNMGNAIAVKGARGMKKPSAKALSGLELQDKLPNARIMYVSATGATEVINLAYASRLGLWGEGTSFANTQDFVTKIESGGIAAMELAAQNMKAMGVYLARSLSYDGVEYNRLEHKLTPDQRGIYNELARAWQLVLHNISAALEATGQQSNGSRRSSVYSQFWGSQLRFFNQVITSMQVPSVIKAIHEDLGRGEAVVVQFVNTNEASQERAISRMAEGDEVEDLDLTPRENLMQYVENSFPVQQYETYIDDNGSERARAVVDSKGNQVLNAEAVAARDKLLDELGSIKTPDNPIDMIINEFGADKVAEVTGRSRRRVMGSEGKMVLEKRSEARNQKDIKGFEDAKKLILLFSEKGGTGASYHPDLTIKNQRKRNHYLLQPGWRGDKAIQGLGRTHRTNQAQAPKYILCTTDLKGQKRFLSSVARRLDHLGALTKGQRQTGSGGIFTARDNLEGPYSAVALRRLFEDFHKGRIDVMSLDEFEDQTGLSLRNEDGTLADTLPPIRQFLNRILNMEIDQQGIAFDLFSTRLDDIINYHAEKGDLDIGLETLQAQKVEKASEQVVYTDQETGAETKYVELDVTNPSRKFPFEQSEASAEQGYFKNVRSGKVWAVSKKRMRTTSAGSVENYHSLVSPYSNIQRINEDTLGDEERWVKLPKGEAKEAWDLEYFIIPETRTDKIHIISGALLPIWDRLRGPTRVLRIQTADGERMLGRIISQDHLSETLKNLGATAAPIKIDSPEIVRVVIDENKTVHLANQWKIKRSYVYGERRIEIMGPVSTNMAELQRKGVFTERIDWKTRYFVPSDERGEAVLDRILQHRPVASVTSTGEGLREKPGSSYGAKAEEQYVPISRKEADALTEKHPELAKQFDVRGIETTGEEGYFMRYPVQAEMTDYVTGERKSKYSKEIFDLYEKYKKRHGKAETSETIPGARGKVELRTLRPSAKVRETKTLFRTAPIDATLTQPQVEELQVIGKEIWNILGKTLPPAAMRKIGLELKPFITLKGKDIAKSVEMHGGRADKILGATSFRGMNALIEISYAHDRETMIKTGIHESFHIAAAWTLPERDYNAIMKYYEGNEETAAEAFADAAMKWETEGIKHPDSGVKRAFLRLARIIEKIRNYLKGKGYMRLEDIFAKLYTGAYDRMQPAGQRAERSGVRLSSYAPALYSQLLKTVNTKVSEMPAKAQSLVKWLQRQNVKPEEMKWMGVEQWIEENQKDGVIDKQAFADFLESNRIELVEDVKGKRGYVLPHDIKIVKVGDGFTPEGPDGHRFTDKIFNTEQEAINWYAERSGREAPPDTKFHQYTLPGGENYREMLVKLPGKKTELDGAKTQRVRTLLKQKEELEDSPPSEDRDRQIRNIQVQIDLVKGAAIEERGYRGAHWDEPNVIGHIRMSDRTDAQGSKILFLEECQSDWLQAGKEKGFRQKKGTLPDGYTVSEAEHTENFGRDTYLSWRVEDPSGTVVASSRTSKQDAIDRLEVGVPPAPFLHNWHEVLMKRALRMAAEGGYDKLSWTTGAQQAERYDLSKQIDEISYVPADKVLKARKGTEIIIERVVEQSEIENYVGKEPAKKILAGIDKTNPYEPSIIEGLDLKVGGEGMAKFYDELLPGFMRKYVKQWGGKVGSSEIEVSSRADRALEAGLITGEEAARMAKREVQSATVHSVTLTPEMKASVLYGGQTMFAVEKTLPGFMQEYLDSVAKDVPAEVKRGIADNKKLFDNPTSPEGFNLPHAGRGQQALDTIQWKIQDRLIHLKKAQRAIEAQKATELPDDVNAYQTEELYHYKVTKRISDADAKLFDPLTEAIHESGHDLEDVELFLRARHAPEANKRLREINPGRDDNTALSGMSNEEAGKIMAKYGTNKAMLDIAAQIDAITKATRQILISDGLATPEQIKAWEDAYDFYVPLKREGKGVGMPKKGKGMQIGGKESQQRLTGSAELKPVNIVAGIMAQHEASIIRAEKAKVGRAMFKLAKEHPNKDLWVADAPELKPFLKQRAGDAGQLDILTGLPVSLSEVVYGRDILYKFNDNVLVTKIDGIEHTITFNEQNIHAQRTVAALKNLGADNSNAVVNALSKVTRFLAIMNTSANPEFILSNFIRDIQTAGYNINDTEAKGVKVKIFKDVFKALSGIRKGVRGKYDTEWAKHYEAFEKAGAQTGWIDYYKDMEAREKTLKKKLELLKPGTWPMVQKAVKATFDFVSDENTAVENAIRLSTYKHLKDVGLSDPKAASAAKNLTVNFNRKGDASQALNALYLFFNASAQGSVRLMYAAGNSPTVRKMMIGTVAFAVMLDIMNRVVGGDDDDGEKKYDKIPTWVKENNLVIMRPNGDYFKIPLPWGYNTLHVLGQVIGEAVDPSYQKGFSPIDSAARLGGAVLASFNPMGSESTLLQIVSPTIIDPFIQWAENKNFAGIPLRPEQNPFDVPKPEYQMYWKNARGPSKWVAKRLNDLSGGDEIKPGLVNVSPEVFDLFLDTFTGGAGKFLDNTLSLPKTLGAKDVDVRGIPFARRLYGKPGEFQTRTKFYDNMSEIRYAEKSIKYFKKIGDNDGLVEARRAPEARFIHRAKRDRNRIGRLRDRQKVVKKNKELSVVEKNKRVDSLDQRINHKMNDFNKRYFMVMRGRDTRQKTSYGRKQKPLPIRDALGAKKKLIYQRYREYLLSLSPEDHKEIRKAVDKYNREAIKLGVPRITYKDMKKQ